jgi:glutathione peroxidase
MSHDARRSVRAVVAGAGLLGFGVIAAQARPLEQEAAHGGPMTTESLYSLHTTALNGKPVDLGQYAGRVTLVVNVASQCGFTPQYAGLEALYQEYSARGFAVLGFPSNDFGGQEPGSAEEIQTFCKKNYGVTFPMFSKLVTKSGPEQSPVYRLLGSSGKLPDWNFCKYVVGKDGKVLDFFPSKVKPESTELRGAIEAALAAQ